MTAYDFFCQVFHITNKDFVREIAYQTETRYLKKGEFVVRMGEVLNDVYFMETGIARGYFLDANGKEVTDCFAFQCGSAAMPISHLEMNIPSLISIELLEDGKFFCVPISVINELKKKYTEITELYNKLLIKAMQEHWELKKVLNSYTAVQRYQWFLEEYPELIHRVTNKHIASFLGMTPVTLSRLRKTLRKEQQAKRP